MKTITQFTLRRFTIFPFIIFLVLNSFQLTAQGWRTTTEELTNSCEFNTAIVETPDGGYLVASHYVDSVSYQNDIRVHKLDQDGNNLWHKNIQRPLETIVTDIMACSDGNFLITGRVDSSSLYNKFIYAVKITSQADVIWEHQYNFQNGANNQVTTLEKAIESSTGGYLFVGTYTETNQSYSVLHKLDTSGTHLWTTVHPTLSHGYDLIENPDQTIMVSRRAMDFGVEQPTITKYSATGNVIWDKSYSGQFPLVVSIEEADNGYFLSTNTGQSSPYIDLKKIDFAGNEIWAKTLPNSGDYLTDMHSADDGGLFIHGYYSGGALALKTDSLGNVEWRNEIRENQGFQRGIIAGTGEYVCTGIGLGDPLSETFNGTNFSVDFIYDCGGRRYYQYCASPMALYITAVPNIPNGLPPYSYSWFNGETGPTAQGICPDYPSFVVTITDGNGINYVAQGTPPDPNESKVEVVKLGADGSFYSNLITGNVFEDDNDDCSYAIGEPGLQNWMVVIDGDESFVTLTDSAGNFNFGIDSGQYTITTPIPNSLFENCLPVTPFAVAANDSLDFEWPVKTMECAVMRLNVGSSRIRRCMNSSFYFHYRNIGTMDATNVSVEVTFDTTLTVLSSSIPWSNQSGNTYTFPIGTVPYNSTSQSFSVETVVSCWVTQGESICLDAHISPDTLCVLPTAWDGSITEIESSCGVDSLTFTIKNTGLNTMGNLLDYFIVEDNVILKNGDFQLGPNQTKLVKVPSNGSTYRMYAEQSPGYFPVGYKPTEAVEGCGLNSSGTFSTGFINNFPPTGNTNYSVDFCGVVTGPYDPNDKSAVPEGYGVEHYINQNVDLDYLIRFQNVGTDTAFNVVIRDTLSDHLDITSLQQGAASHNYRLEIVGSNILKFTFPDIHLVDSITNEPGSHGFVSFEISQLDSLPLGTIIHNSAAIYFDYEAPVITNQTWHEVGEDFIEVISSTEDTEEQAAYNVKVYPNPFNEFADIVLTHPSTAAKMLNVCDAMGRTVLTTPMENNSYRIYRNQLPAGVYFFMISDQQQLVKSGKFIVK